MRAKIYTRLMFSILAHHAVSAIDVGISVDVSLIWCFLHVN